MSISEYYDTWAAYTNNLALKIRDILHHLELPSTEILVLVSTLVSAFAGAAGAQWISERRRYKDNLEREFRLNNAAIVITFNIANSLFTFKKQLCKPMHDTFKKQIEELNRHRNKNHSGGDIFDFQASLTKFDPPLFPFDQLEKILLGNVNLDQVTLTFFFQLKGSAQILTDAARARNQWIDSFQSRKQKDASYIASLYFGIPDPLGHQDTTHPDLVDGIYDTNDSCIFFSTKLAELLVDHGELIKRRAKKKKWKIININWNESLKYNLLPDDNEFLSWANMIEKGPKS